MSWNNYGKNCQGIFAGNGAKGQMALEVLRKNCWLCRFVEFVTKQADLAADSVNSGKPVNKEISQIARRDQRPRESNFGKYRQPRCFPSCVVCNKKHNLHQMYWVQETIITTEEEFPEDERYVLWMLQHRIRTHSWKKHRQKLTKRRTSMLVSKVRKQGCWKSS